jgi:hypothetical protein
VRLYYIVEMPEKTNKKKYVLKKIDKEDNEK